MRIPSLAGSALSSPRVVSRTMSTPVQTHISEVQKILATGDATEHSYRHAVIALFKSHGMVAINEPKQVKGKRPDLKVFNGHKNLVGHIECKDVGTELDGIVKSPQITGYLGAFPNLLFTDHLEWRWFTEGKHRETVKVAALVGGKVKVVPGGQEALTALLGRFAACSAENPATPKDLARNLALKAKLARENISEALQHGDSTFRGLLDLFRKALKPDMKKEEFADVLAQTLTYGLFARWTEKGEVPKSMPFLRTFLKQILRSSEDDVDVDLTGVKWVVDGIEDLLGRTPLTVLDGFGEASGMKDPVLHFYEDFLEAYDPAIRKSRGVWYTPQPIVDYIVNSVDTKVREDLGKPLGLADPSVHILDPACGTGTFLLTVVRKVCSNLEDEGYGKREVGKVVGDLLDRLYGFELMMAPYAIAHLALFRMLRTMGVTVPDKKRVKVFLTDTLADPPKVGNEYESTPLGSLGMLSAPAITKALVEEAEGARKVKETEPVMVVLGNPPYNNRSTNRGEWITGLTQDYKRGLNERKLNLDDDYVKFWRFAQHVVSRDLARGGIVGFITPHGWLDAPTFRGMRASILNTFDKVDVLDLHGNGNKKERTPEALLEEVGDDENVFDIKQGVAITIAVRSPGLVREPQVRWAEVWGTREKKLGALAESVSWVVLKPQGTGHLLAPSGGGDEGYTTGWSVKDVFRTSGSGIKTDRDDLFIGFTRTEVGSRMRTFYEPLTPDFIEAYNVKDSSSYPLLQRRAKTRFQEMCVQGTLFRPLDPRVIYYNIKITSRSGYEVMRHLLRPDTGNVALHAPRQCADDWAHTFVTQTLSDVNLIGTAGRYGSGSVFPLYLLPPKTPAEGTAPEDDIFDILGPIPARPNLSEKFINAFTTSTGLYFDPADPKTSGDDFTSKWTPLDFLHYVYGVLHDPGYRTKYQEFLKRDFPRIPVPTVETLPQARTLRALGAKLVALHLPDRWGEHPDLTRKSLDVSYLQGEGSDVMEKLVRGPETDRVYINKTQYFEGVTEAVWEARIGGYQPAQKWLKDRKGRTLTSEDILHYRRVCKVLAETARLMRGAQP